MRDIRLQVQGATMQHITKPEFEAILIPVPALDSQRSIAAQLSAQLTAAGELSQHAQRREEACNSLLVQSLRAITSSTNGIALAKLSGLVEIRRSPSVASDGEAEVRTITSGCLTPRGFRSDRLSTGRMSADSAVVGTVNAGEVLVARSNTEELVGRAALYPGGPEGVVATDLIFRLAPDPARLVPEFLAQYLAGLQLTGYWRDRSSGASSTMKKITKALLRDLEIPVPPLEEQGQIIEELHGRLDVLEVVSTAVAAQRDSIAAMPAALLRRAFANPA